MSDNTETPMSYVRQQNIRTMLTAPPIIRPPEVDWQAIARELMEELDRREAKAQANTQFDVDHILGRG